VWRTEVFRLLTTPELEELLWRIGDATARLINMENFRRRQMFSMLRVFITKNYKNTLHGDKK
jgi:hypothetical protein